MNRARTRTAELPARGRRGRGSTEDVGFAAGGRRSSGRRGFADPLDGVDVKGLGRGLDPEAVQEELEAILISQAHRLTAAAERALTNTG
jgi:hypothetical protein